MQCSTSEVATQTDEIGDDSNSETAMEVAQHLMSPLPGSHIIQIPIKFFFDQSISSLTQLHSRLLNLKCLQNWFLMANSSLPVTKIQLVSVSGQNVFTMEISQELQWSLLIGDRCVLSSSSVFQSVPSTITSLEDLRSIVTYVDKCSVCKGNADPRFMPLVAKSKGLFKDRSGKI